MPNHRTVSSKLHKREKEIGDERRGSLFPNSYLAVSIVGSAETPRLLPLGFPAWLRCHSGATGKRRYIYKPEACLCQGQMAQRLSGWGRCSSTHLGTQLLWWQEDYRFEDSLANTERPFPKANE